MEKFLSQYLSLAKLNIFHKIHIWQGDGIVHPTWPVLEMFLCSMQGHLSLPWEDSELAGTSGSSNIHPAPLVQPIQPIRPQLGCATNIHPAAQPIRSVLSPRPHHLSVTALYCYTALQQHIVFKIVNNIADVWCSVSITQTCKNWMFLYSKSYR